MALIFMRGFLAGLSLNQALFQTVRFFEKEDFYEVSDLSEWFTIWIEDKRTILATMVRNLTADLDAGYDYFGNSATRQREEIEAYRAKFEAEMDKFDGMTPEAINHWCYRDLKRRGAID